MRERKNGKEAFTRLFRKCPGPNSGRASSWRRGRVWGVRGDGESTWAQSPGEPAGTRQRACASAQEDSTLPALLCSHDLLSSLPIAGAGVRSRAIPEPHKPPGTRSLWALQRVDWGPLILQQPLRFQSPRSYTHTIWQPVCGRSTAPPPQPIVTHSY